jgi:hypothetical protein
MLMQALFYLKTDNELTKFIKVFITGMYDSKGFMIMYAIMVLYFTLIFHLLGCTFDDEESNVLETILDGDYDGDFAMLSYGVIALFSNIRSAYGDLMMPGYGIWI